MEPEKEKEAVGKVAERLAEKFPDVSPEHIDDVVQSEYEALADAPVRDYIPVLVEHEAREDLTRESRETGDAPN
ncbi:hypothetical protein B7R54_17970 [Subtercola boreus]|uniref:Protein-tyrosine-phosphatase-like N-terminal domain-containing protein n=1 Tax=Subtercola boreus TaxID=120213 RepID=A0A3E0VLL7_9MICO|nr:hypothetical protein [Subtercola boreus]RFA10884.1 hypothetical protein B7R54_17970 [Subtercola boreus]TQL55531.1 hypothetical protein FB464_3099 [Subtercola boreus]